MKSRPRAGRAPRRALLGLPPLVATGLLAAACGSRSGLHVPPPAPPEPECVVDADCPGIEDLCKPVACRADGEVDGGTPTEDRPGQCVKLAKVDCDDRDPCTNDACEAATGKCRYTHATLDLDGDGYFAPLPGHLPGDPGSCGDDCDDTNASAHPGGIEICDGVDNDCNGVVDDNMTYVPSGAGDIRLSSDSADASYPSGLAWNGDHYFAVYGEGALAFEQLLNPDGSSVPPGPKPFVAATTAIGGGPVVWTGDRFGTVWQDNRDGGGVNGGYEVYFAGLQPDGTKIAPGDVRVTFAGGFSVGPSIIWTGNEFLLVWQDDRNGFQNFDVFAQRVALDGSLVGDNMPLSDSASTGLSVESPAIAAGLKTVGVVSRSGPSQNGSVLFQPFSLDLTTSQAAPITLSDGLGDAELPTIVWNRDRYIVAWEEHATRPHAIFGAAVSEAGKVLVPPTPLTSTGPFDSRYAVLRPLGDRLLVVYSDTRDNNDGYELYSRMILPDLSPVTPETRLTNATGNSVHSLAVFGPSGDVGIEFRDDRLGAQDTWFTRLVCNVAMTP